MKPSHWRYYLLVVTMAEIEEVARLHREVDERSPWLEVSHEVGEYLTPTSYPRHLNYRRQHSCSSNCTGAEERIKRNKEDLL
jgi:hypothetical protein